MSSSGSCSHCNVPPEVADRPCKPFSKDEKDCVNRAETEYCYETLGDTTFGCETRVDGKFSYKYWIEWEL